MNLNIIVINNGDNDDYADIKKQFPYVIYHKIDRTENGAARQYAIDHTYGSYFTFLDAGNTFIPGADKNILNTIKNNIFYDLYHWDYYNKNKIKIK